MPKDQVYQLNVNTLGRLANVEEFEDVIIKTGEGTRAIRVKDVGKVDLGGKAYDFLSLFNGAGRIVWGTDQGFGLPMYRNSFHILETLDEHFYAWNFSTYHWPLYGLALSDPVLQKVYNANALADELLANSKNANTKAAPAQKSALLRVLSAIGGPSALKAVRGTVSDADPGTLRAEVAEELRRHLAWLSDAGIREIPRAPALPAAQRQSRVLQPSAPLQSC